MRSDKIIAGIVVAACALGLGLVTYSAAQEVEECVERAPKFKSGGAGYELIDVARREVWATKEFSPQDFHDLRLPLHWAHWFKNDPRVILASSARFVKSPGCADGEYTFMTAFGRNFVQVVHLDGMSVLGNGDAKLRSITLEKHHVVTFAADQTVRVLQSPEGERYIAVAQTLDRSDAPVALPAGWSIDTHHLAQDLQVDLVGEVRVLRTTNEDSYQGPLRVSF